MVQDVIYPGEGSMCSCEKVEIHCFVVKCPMDINQFSWSIVSFKVCVSLLFPCLVDLSIGVSGILKSPTILVLLLIFPYFWGKKFGCTRSSLLLRTSLFAASWGYSVNAVHWLFKPVFLLMQFTGSRVLSLSSCGLLVQLPWDI